MDKHEECSSRALREVGYLTSSSKPEDFPPFGGSHPLERRHPACSRPLFPDFAVEAGAHDLEATGHAPSRNLFHYRILMPDSNSLEIIARGKLRRSGHVPSQEGRADPAITVVLRK